MYAALEDAGLQPAPEAGRRDLIRRLSFSLTGLPPDPGEVEAFVADQSPGAYERLVDRLLASPHFGERWARHWLDLVRFAESEGFERDLPRDHAWPYRDYVIRSSNEDRPYLQFAREQIAGDAIEPVASDGIVATTMLTLGPVDAVGLTSAIPVERMTSREDLLEDMLGTVTQTFLGLTVNCARCHDHKFDPITQEEYYRMKAAFQAVWPPTRPVPSAGLDVLFPHGRPALSPARERARADRVNRLEGRIAHLAAELGGLYRSARPSDLPDEAPRPFARWTFDADGRADLAPLHLRFVGAAEVGGGSFRLRRSEPGQQLEASGRGEGDEAIGKTGFGVSPKLAGNIRERTLEAWLGARSEPDASATVMEIRGLSGYRGAAVDGIRFVAGERSRWENYSVGRFRSARAAAAPERLAAGDRVHLAFAYAADGTIALFRNGKPYGEPYKPDPGVAAGRLQTYPAGDAVVRFAAGKQFDIAEARLYDRALSPAEVDASYRNGIRDFTRDQLAGLAQAGRRDRIETLERELAGLREELAALPEPALTHAALVRDEGPTHVLLRGAADRPGKRVQPGGLACVEDEGASEGARRRSMAEWIANRIWQGHFGHGFVSNPSDLGYNGGRPSHPELLDWLAGELVSRDWSLKALHRLVVTSRAYRQSSRFAPRAAAVDAGNRLLWRFPSRRLDGEAARDAMLAASGELNGALHGPSFRPFEFGEQRGSLRNYVLTGADTPAHRRRTIYRMNVITGRDPLLEALDCPIPSTRTPRRRSTTTALQALSPMNSAFVQQRARGFAARLQREAPDPARRIRRAFALALGRPPRRGEMESSLRLAERAGLEALCWGLLNTSEFLYVR